MKHMEAACRSLAGGGSRLFLTDRERLGRSDILAHKWVNGQGEAASLRLIEDRDRGQANAGVPTQYRYNALRKAGDL